MKVKSLYGPKEVPHRDAPGGAYLTDENDVVDVPDELGRSLCEQVDAWVPVKAGKAQADEKAST